jgi:hypothetical protein
MLKTIRLLLCLGACVPLAWMATSTAAGASWPGRINLTIRPARGGIDVLGSLELSALRPGDVVYAPLTIVNRGSSGLTYSMSTSPSDPDGLHLATQLTLAMKRVPDTDTCDSAGLGYAASGDVIGASGPLADAAVQGRTLPAFSREVACLRVELPAETGNAYQGARTTATFVVDSGPS